MNDQMTENVKDTQDFPEVVRKFAQECIIKPRKRSYLIPVLHKLQGEIGYLDDAHLEEVGKLFEIPVAEIKSVATFYHFFTLTPKGKFRLSVCLGTACHVKGAGDILKKITDLVGIKEGDVSEDGRFSLESARCVGMCALAPVVMVNDKVFGNVTVDDVEHILKEFGFEGSK